MKSFPGASLLSLLIAGVAVAQAPPVVTPAAAPPAAETVRIVVDADSPDAPPVGMTPGSSPSPYYLAAPAGNTVMPAIAGAASPSSTPDTWITYPQAYCCGPVGGDGPIKMEVFLRVGTISPVGGSTMDRALRTGWEIEVGGRSLFFNVPRDRAWTVGLSIANGNNTGANANVVFPGFTNPENVFGFNRTWANLALGREYFLHPITSNTAKSLWAGWDASFRYGTVRVDGFNTVLLTSTRHNSRQFGDAIAVHTDLECPGGACTFRAGIRLEYSYDWISVYGSHSDFGAINILGTVGVRF
jgi:hypothetical protein